MHPFLPSPPTAVVCSKRLSCTTCVTVHDTLLQGENTDNLGASTYLLLSSLKLSTYASCVHGTFICALQSKQHTNFNSYHSLIKYEKNMKTPPEKNGSSGIPITINAPKKDVKQSTYRHLSATLSLSGSMSTAITEPPPTSPCVFARIATANNLFKAGSSTCARAQGYSSKLPTILFRYYAPGAAELV